MIRLCLFLLAIFSLSGCEICREHRVACAIGMAVAATCLGAAAGSHHDDQNRHDVVIIPVPCANGGCK